MSASTTVDVSVRWDCQLPYKRSVQTGVLPELHGKGNPSCRMTDQE